MRKYTLVSLVFILSFTLLGFAGVKSVGAAPVGCTSSFAYSPITGEPCGTTSIVTCPAGDLFSSSTGQRCTAWTDVSPSAGGDLRIGSRGEAVRAFQQMLLSAGYNPGPIDGIYGLRTDTAAGLYYKRYPAPTPCPTGTVMVGMTASIPPHYICQPIPPSSLIIDGVSGPQSLDINQQGTWTVTAHDVNGGNLSYSVNWGDISSLSTSSGSFGDSTSKQLATFTHSYAKAGVYKPVFTVRSQNTIRCITTPCPSNAGSAETSLTVNVGNVDVPPSSDIVVISPNGGEIWVKGTTQTINWRDAKSISTHEIKLQPTCGSDFCTLQYRPPYTIANTQGSSYNWSVGRTLDNNIVPDGAYFIQVCQTGGDRCDTSDRFFTITSGKADPESTKDN